MPVIMNVRFVLQVQRLCPILGSLSLFSHISCYPRRRFAKVNASVVSDAVITYTGRRRGRTGEDRQGAASCLPLTPAGGGRAGQGSGPPRPRDLLRRLRGASRSRQGTRERPEHLPAFLLRGTRMGQSCSSAPCRHDREKPFSFFTAKRPVRKRPPLQFIHCLTFRGVGSAGTWAHSSDVRTHTLYKGGDPTTSTLPAITRSKTAAAV